jgi:ArsR family transcriptional regulator, nickel/cobalt-responsive transcriptional repressor
MALSPGLVVLDNRSHDPCGILIEVYDDSQPATCLDMPTIEALPAHADVSLAWSNRSQRPRRQARIDLTRCSCYNACVSHGHEPDLAYLDVETARVVAETMQALSTPSRVRILSRLAAGPCSVGELTRAVEMEQSAVSQQLRVLRHLGLVVGERQGRSIIYALHDDHVGVLLAEAVAHTEHLRHGLAARPSEHVHSA